MNRKLAIALFIVFLLTLAVMVAGQALQNVHLFEDGSWGVGSFPYAVSGCFPWGICS